MPSLLKATIPTPLGPMTARADDRGLRLLDFTDRRGLAGRLERIVAAGASIAAGEHPAHRAARQALDAYFSGDSGWERLLDPLEAAAPTTAFERAAWDALCRIPLGQTRSYAVQARAIGRPDGARAVARANGVNFLAIVVPCHRVVGADGSPVGYGGGIERKRWLLAHEAAMSGGLFAAVGRSAAR
ncbi:MAG: methylated-DNA--[protein]-cysteine S-methyltransferase [Phycisphaerales bacterium]|nr:methylated-DNA--[protein]-cysteine S-methyltransferase [Phycisphaerales bacterium]